MRFYWPIAKIDGEQRMVWGYASTEAEDDQGETVTRAALAAALDGYMRFANIREMHRASAVGVAKEAAVDDKGLYLGAKIVDPEAWEKVVEGVYKGFSIGGRVTARDPADRSVITGLALTEISVVDRPANPEAVFDCWKLAAAGAADPDGGGMPAAGDHPADIGHADPGYQADGKRRYPLDSERHIRAAWAYIHQADNAARYTAAQLARIKSRIVAAWRERIDPAGPPAAAPADRAVTKADIAAAVREALAELLPGLPARPEPANAVQKLADAILPRLDALQRRVDEIAATPLPPQTLARGAALAKRDDGGGPPLADDAEIVAALARMSGEERTLALIKAAHATPIRR